MSERRAGIKRKRSNMEQPRKGGYIFKFHKDHKQQKTSIASKHSTSPLGSRDLSASPLMQKKTHIQRTRQQQLTLESESEYYSSEVRMAE